MHRWLNVSLAGTGPDTHVNSEKQLTWHLSCAWPYCTVFEGPPSLKSIFIFAVLTFSSSSQRHNEGFLQLLWPASVQYMQTKHSERKKLLFISAFFSFRACIPHKENCHLFWSITEPQMGVIAEALTFSVNVLQQTVKPAIYLQLCLSSYCCGH